MFLDSIRERQEEEERQRKEKDGEEVKNFKEYARPRFSDFKKRVTPTHRAVAARTSAINQPSQIKSVAPVTAKPSTKKDFRKTLKGVVVKKRTKPDAVSPSVSDTKSESAKSKQVDDNVPPVPKRRKIDSP